MNKASKLYISDLTETSEQASQMGDTEVLIAGESDKKKEVSNEKVGNQSKEYYSM